MKKSRIVNPSMCDTGRSYRSRAYARIEYDEAKQELSICGVVGPFSSGNCAGSAGQCIDEIGTGEPNAEEGWTREMLDKFCNIWRKWHLNGMRPYCQHQQELGWNEKACEKVTMHKYVLTIDAIRAQNAAVAAAKAALKAGETFTPTPEQTFLANLPYSITSYKELDGREAELYKTDKDCPTEIKALGWLHEHEHPEGILCKPCPVCGYKYGTAWLHEDVPEDELEWLFALPEAKHEPAWV